MARKLPYTIRHRRKTYTVQRTHTVNDDKYLLLKKLTRQDRWLALPAHRSEFESLVVVHLMPSGSLTNERMRVLRRTAANPPFAPSILSCDLGKSSVAIVTDWVQGESLRDYVDRTSMTDRPISPYESVRLYRGLVQTLCHFHRATGLVHGDLSPENLVVRAQGSGLSLIDFGSAWRMNGATSKESGDGYRAGYASPEVVDDRAPNELSDQFSAGVILFELLTGQLPYDRLGGNAGRIPPAERAQLWTPPSELARLGNGLPRRLWKQIDRFVCKNLALDSNGRFVSRSDWLDETVRLFDALQAKPTKVLPTGITRFLSGLLFPKDSDLA